MVVLELSETITKSRRKVNKDKCVLKNAAEKKIAAADKEPQ